MRLRATFWLDAGLLLAFAALETVPFTGLVLHEWLGLAIVAMILAHLLLSWPWIATNTRRFTSGSTRTRVNYLINLALFASMTVLILSGVLISEYAIPQILHVRPADLPDAFRWDSIHDRLSDVVVVFAGLHLALNWDWTFAAARKLFAGRAAQTR